jgi:hypothetical protein
MGLVGREESGTMRKDLAKELAKEFIDRADTDHLKWGRERWHIYVQAWFHGALSPHATDLICDYIEKYIWHGGAFISIYNHRGDDCDFLPPDPDVEWSIERIEKAIAKHMEQEIFYGKTHKDCKKAD